jgi:hypothetical protein
MTEYAVGVGSSVWWMGWKPNSGEPTELIDHHELWFSHEFIHRPLSGFIVDTSGAECVVCREYLLPHRTGTHGDDNGWRGIIIKHLNPQRVWVLTGKYNARTNGYLGRWPD